MELSQHDHMIDYACDWCWLGIHTPANDFLKDEEIEDTKKDFTLTTLKSPIDLNISSERVTLTPSIRQTHHRIRYTINSTFP